MTKWGLFENEITAMHRNYRLWMKKHMIISIPAEKACEKLIIYSWLKKQTSEK